MQKINLLFAILFLSAYLSAQPFTIPVGKKMQALTDTKMSMVMTAMGQEVTVETNNGSKNEYEFNTVTPRGYTMSSVLKSLKTKTTTMGTEINMDSDNENDRKNPLYAEVFKMLNKPTEIVVENNKATVSGNAMEKLSQMSSIMDNLTDMTRFILTDQYTSKLNPGNKWSDSAISTETSMINEYTVEKNDANGIALFVKTFLKINTTITQAGMEAKTTLKGQITAHRLYNKTTGVLHKDDSDGEFDGNIEVMAQAMPVHMKLKAVTVID